MILKTILFVGMVIVIFYAGYLYGRWAETTDTVERLENCIQYPKNNSSGYNKRPDKIAPPKKPSYHPQT